MSSTWLTRQRMACDSGASVVCSARRRVVRCGLKPLVAAREATSFEVNCRQLLRVDFGAAGDLLNWSMEQQGRGHQVTFKQVNRLVAAFFGVIGINDSARVMLRTD